MAMTLLAFALLAAPASAQSLTAGQVYDGCTRLLAHGRPAPSGMEHMAEAYCEAVATIDLAAADALRLVSDGQPSAEIGQYCLPDAIIDASDAAALQRAFIAYVDAHPAARSDEAGRVFERALTEAWPCPG